MYLKNLILCLLLIIAYSKLSNAIACTTDANCNNGVCISLQCVCSKGYADRDGVACTYKQKEKVIAFCLSFFIGFFGADWFYLAAGNGVYVFAGIMKLLTGMFFFLGCIPLLIAGLFAGLSRDSIFGRVGTIVGVILITLMLLFVSTSILWYFIDWIRILTDVFKDGNNIGLKDF